MSIKGKIDGRLSIGAKLVSSAYLIIILLFILVLQIFQTYISRLILEDQVKGDMFSFEKALDRFSEIQRELDSGAGSLNGDDDLLDVLTSDFSGEDTDDIKDRLDRLDRISSRLYLNSDSLGSLIFIGRNGLVYYFKQYEGGAYLGKSEVSDYLSEQIGLWTLSGQSPYGLCFADPELWEINTPLDGEIKEYLGSRIFLQRAIGEEGGEPAGRIIMNLNRDFLRSYFPRSDKGGQDYLLSGSGRVLWTNGDAGEGTLSLPSEKGDFHFIHRDEGEEDLITQSEFSPYGFRFVRTRKLALVYDNMNRTKRLLYVALLLCFLYIPLVSRSTAASVSAPFRDLQESMARRGGDSSEESTFTQKGRLINRLIRFYLIAVLLPGFLFLILTFQSYKALYERELLDYSTELIEVKKNILDYDLNSYRLKLMGTVFNDTVQDVLFNLNREDKEEWEGNLQYELAALLEKKYITHREPTHISFYSNQGELLFSSEGFREASSHLSDDGVRQQLSESSGEMFFLGITKDLYGRSQLSFTRKINYINSVYNPQVGFVALDIPMDYVKESLSGEIQPFYDLFLLEDNRGESLVIHRRSVDGLSGIGEIHKGNLSYSISRVQSSLYDLSYSTVISRRSINRTLGPVKWYAVIAVILLFILIILASALISLSIVVPFRRLVFSLKKGIGEGRHYLAVPVRGNDEIAQLAAGFNRMVEEMNGLIEENYRSAVREKDLLYRQKEAQFHALQSQINPHFLYNTLDSINWMAYKAGAQDVCRMVNALARFFRGAVGQEDEITVQEELDHLEQYIYIQRKRFYGKITFSVEVDEEIRNNCMINLILQPLVENCVTHGLEGRNRAGHISVGGFAEGDTIRFEVIDDGAGMEKDILEKVRRLIDSPEEGADHVGLRNVAERLRLRYGDKGGLILDSEPEKGTRVGLFFPAHGGEGIT